MSICMIHIIRMWMIHILRLSICIIQLFIWFVCQYVFLFILKKITSICDIHTIHKGMSICMIHIIRMSIMHIIFMSICIIHNIRIMRVSTCIIQLFIWFECQYVLLYILKKVTSICDIHMIHKGMSICMIHIIRMSIIHIIRTLICIIQLFMLWGGYGQ